MDFSWNEVQSAIAQAVRDALDHAGDDPWKALGDAGLLTLGMPARLGGEGLGLLETSIVLTEVGRRALPVPALATLALGILPVARFAGEALQDSLLAEGRLLTAAVDGLTVSSTVDGVAHGVPYGLEAHRILVQGHDVIAVLDPGADGVTVSPMPTSSGAPEAIVRCSQAVPEAVFGGDLRYFAVAGSAAMADGLLRGALDLTAAHIGTREQFGRPLATFQAVAQQMADVYIAWRTTHLAALAACVNPGDAPLAAYWLRTEAPSAMRTCHHLHGGIGLDITYPLHRYTSMLKDLLRLVGVADAPRA
ncbi:MAG TPA: acyl-CoA dehydrogenase family protein [Candidatus Limnocylindrales bacterium]|nr:acyl-CoA dehydrogenase family protein [Candidatus Limnocylindrales bacterium]